MTDSITVRINWVVYCHECGKEHTERMDVTDDVEYAPPTLPSECSGCGYGLRRDRHSWHRTFTVNGYLAHGGD